MPSLVSMPTAIETSSREEDTVTRHDDGRPFDRGDVGIALEVAAEGPVESVGDPSLAVVGVPVLPVGEISTLIGGVIVAPSAIVMPPVVAKLDDLRPLCPAGRCRAEHGGYGHRGHDQTAETPRFRMTHTLPPRWESIG